MSACDVMTEKEWRAENMAPYDPEHPEHPVGCKRMCCRRRERRVTVPIPSETMEQIVFGPEALQS